MSFFQIGPYNIQTMSNGMYKVNNSFFLNPQQLIDQMLIQYLKSLWNSYENDPINGFANDVNFDLLIKQFTIQDLMESDIMNRAIHFVSAFNNTFGCNIEVDVLGIENLKTPTAQV